MSFFAMNIAADNEPFLLHTQRTHFHVHLPPVRFRTDLDRREYHVFDDDGPICTLRAQPDESLGLPLLPGDTRVFTHTAGRLQERRFKWRGMARLHVAPAVACTIHDHPFFRGVEAYRAEPLPTRVFSSRRDATGAAQLFTQPRPI